MASPRTEEQAVTRAGQIVEEMERVAAKPDDQFSAADEKYLNDLKAELDGIDTLIRDLRRQNLANPSLTRTRGDNPTHDPFGEPESIGATAQRFRGDPWEATRQRDVFAGGMSATDARARALSAVERVDGASDGTRQRMTELLEDPDAGLDLAASTLVRLDPLYLSAFTEILRRPEHPMLTDDETRAVRRVADATRAMSLTDAAGGYLVPFQLEPSVIVTDDLSESDIRRVARKVTATGDVWNGVSSGAVSWSWDAEAAEVSDDATTFAQPSIPIHKAAGFVPISLEAYDDGANVTEAVTELLVAGRQHLDNTAFATGSGSGQPTGIVTALTGGASEISSATTDTFAIGDVYGVYNAVPARYRDRATWLANELICVLIRQFDTAGGASLWTQLAGATPERLIGRPVARNSVMDGTITALADNRVLILGDFSNYVIADRRATTVEFIPHLFATGNNRPSGQRGWYAWQRVGADSVNDGAFAMLNVT